MTPCALCWNMNKCERHRIIPGLKYNGKYIEENIIMICKRCHTAIHRILRTTNRTDFHEVIEEVRAMYEPKPKYPRIKLHT